ncbi:MAG: HD-GYP domain-containing protein [Gorillibacterium sp.]|nr:HD-GYP domain-containing protein [Gorillibacterium sp.]
MIIHVMDLEDGDVLLTDMFNKYGLLVLSSGTVLTGESVSRLLQHQLDNVDIVPRSVKPEDTTHPFHANYSKWKDNYLEAVQSAEAVFEMARATGTIDGDFVQSGFLTLSDSFEGKNDIAFMLLTLNQNDDYTYRHSIQVGMICYYLAKWLGKSEAECRSVGTAGYLHDIGKTKTPIELLTKPGSLTEEEFKIIKEHTSEGFSLISESIGNTEWALTALQHHERLDGSGYPYGLKGNEIHQMSRIVTIADIYSAMITPAPYRKSRDLLNVLRELHHMSFGKLDPHITQVFIRNMLPNMIGKEVTLNNGETGKIVLTNPTDVFNPLIQIEDHFVDLAQMSHLWIVHFVTDEIA